MPVTCNRGCGKSWPRDPVLEVTCPDCRAPVGAWCRRPSDHRADPPHAPRDIVADRAGHYGPCLRGLCGLENVEARKAGPARPSDGPDQLSLF